MIFQREGSGNTLWGAVKQGSRLLLDAHAEWCTPTLGTVIPPTLVDATVLGACAVQMSGLPTLPPDELDSLLWQARWAQSCRPTFQPSHNLTAQLLLTESESVRMRDIVWPFESFAVQLPDDCGLVVMDGSTPVPAGWLIVSRMRGFTDAQALRFLDLGNEVVRDLSQLPRLAREFTAMRAEALAPAEPDRFYIRVVANEPMTSPTSVRGLGVYFARPLPKPEEHAGRWISAATPLGQDPACSSPGLDIAPEDARTLRTAWRLLVNLMLYVESERREGRVNLTRGYRPERAGKVRSNVIPVGTTVQLPKAVRDAAAAYGGRMADAPRWKMACSFVVRGHSKMVHYGKAGAETKRVFIAPYLKGEGKPLLQERRYRVDTPST